MVEVKRQWPYLSGTLILSSVVSICLYLGSIHRGAGTAYSYMLWNLLLAWVPLLLVRVLLRVLHTWRWLSWQGIVVSALWLLFLPNSFYIVSDYVHLQNVPDVDILYDAVMFTSFVMNGLILGFISLYLFHVELRKRLSALRTKFSIVGVLLVCSFAIYMGRYLRWSTWDVARDPTGLLFDVSNRLIDPWSYPRMVATTTVFFVLLVTMYLVMYNIIRTLRLPQRP